MLMKIKAQEKVYFSGTTTTSKGNFIFNYGDTLIVNENDEIFPLKIVQELKKKRGQIRTTQW